MNKALIILLLTIGFVSCKNPEKETDRVEIVKQYVKALDASDHSKMSDWIADSLTKIEGEHKQIYSKSDYFEFLKWDSVFDPNYDILEILEEDEVIKSKISKMDQRISFLHETPFITNQTITFSNHKISSVAIEYENFDEVTWERNRKALLDWIDGNHPELNGFLYDQTEVGAIKFSKAIELYRNKK
ncbi:hypothetical protein [Gelidibacter maritimus]|uniref:Nuclear transport factor 2 family protein n=1 Tax=Gelidibacter maritimus TaxID=2761487 RepID=A0A7W2R363_9FLAO|nr:hypothetical protein [Gelidibacter maritimus]MBA6152474.1 hypothetical protein [Gelidibacter maritimus]